MGTVLDQHFMYFLCATLFIPFKNFKYEYNTILTRYLHKNNVSLVYIYFYFIHPKFVTK